MGDTGPLRPVESPVVIGPAGAPPCAPARLDHLDHTDGFRSVRTR
ncbi:hypothetical protein SLI_3223 [Streptomyces lividans 1326]|uniref:Uncharacterized protein n=1 Tax=Streptomyces lividans 1326 TaxID=1200984 RepID=A0A7U9HCN9_STRLI|nr:hypothetical protein SLI_3223 [Streptomyces lividans 1326]